MLKYWLLFLFWISSCSAVDLIWPTSNRGFIEGKSLSAYIRPTISGKVESGLFGMVRNSGKRFHEGIDIKPLKFDRKGESLDPCYAVTDSKVAYMNKVAGNSEYGRYIVLTSIENGVELYTLYAHLREISSDLKIGHKVKMGQKIGVVGRSSRTPIPKQLSHVHFEVGVRMSDRYDRYYKRQKYKEKNHHKNWNGMNLEGVDPLQLFKDAGAGKLDNVATYLKGLPTGFKLRVNFGGYPEFVRRNPGLLAKELPKDQVKAWEIEFTWHGVPKKWTPLKEWNKTKRVELLEYDEKKFTQMKNRMVFRKTSKGIDVGNTLDRMLFLLLGDFKRSDFLVKKL